MKIENVNLFQLLNKLERNELKNFNKYLRSPYFNQRKDVVKLWNYLEKQLPNVPNRAQIFLKVYPDRDYDDQQFRLLISWLHKHLESFVRIEQYQKNAIQQDLDLLNFYYNKNYSKRFDTIRKRLKKKWKQLELFDSNYHYREFQLAAKHYRFALYQRRSNPSLLTKMTNHLDRFYIAEKLRHSCIATTQQLVFSGEYDFGLLKGVILQIEEHADYLSVPAISVYYYCFLMMRDIEDNSKFWKFKAELLEHHQSFSAAETKDLYLLAINFCLHKYNKGQSKFINSAMDFYRLGLEQNYFLDNDVLSRFTFRNIVTAGLITKQYQWVDDFIENYYVFLAEKYRQTSYNFSHARLAYERREYQQALSLLESTDYKDILINISAKTVMAKIYYQLDEFEALESHLHAMQTYIRRKEVGESYRKRYSNFTNFLQKIMMVNPFDRDAIQEVQNKLGTYKVIAERKWLKEVISNL